MGNEAGGFGQAGQRRGSHSGFVNDHRCCRHRARVSHQLNHTTTEVDGKNRNRCVRRHQGKAGPTSTKRLVCLLPAGWQPTDRPTDRPRHRAIRNKPVVTQQRSFLSLVDFVCVLLSCMADGPLFDLLFGSLFFVPTQTRLLLLGWLPPS